MTSEIADNLWKAYSADRSIANRNRLVEQYMPMVESIARQMRKRLRAVDLNELRSAGFLGLIQAIERFDTTRGLRFGSFAGHRVRGEMFDYARREDRVPRQTRQRFKRWAETCDVLTARLSRPPTEHEIEQALGITAGAWRDTLNAAEVSSSILSLSQTSTEHREAFGYDVTDDEPEVGYQSDANEAFEHILNKSGLSNRERVIMQMTHRDDCLQKEAAAVLGVVPSLVCRELKLAHRRIKATLTAAA